MAFSARISIILNLEGSEEKLVDPVLEKIKRAAATDPIMVELKELILHGFPNEKCNLSYEMRPFWSTREKLAVDEGDAMIVVGARLLIPELLRPIIKT